MENIHNEDVQNLYSSPYNITMITSRRITWAEHVACLRHFSRESLKKEITSTT